MKNTKKLTLSDKIQKKIKTKYTDRTTHSCLVKAYKVTAPPAILRGPELEPEPHNFGPLGAAES